MVAGVEKVDGEHSGRRLNQPDLSEVEVKYGTVKSILLSVQSKEYV